MVGVPVAILAEDRLTFAFATGAEILEGNAVVSGDLAILRQLSPPALHRRGINRHKNAIEYWREVPNAIIEIRHYAAFVALHPA